MIKNLPIFLVIALVVNFSQPAAASQSVDNSGLWQEWSTEVFELARKNQKLILLDVTAEWCVFCEKMDNITYRDKRVLSTINDHYIPVRVADETHPKLAKKYARYGRPLTVIFKPDGTEIVARAGYLEPQWMMWFLQAIVHEQDQAKNH